MCLICGYKTIEVLVSKQEGDAGVASHTAVQAEEAICDQRQMMQRMMATMTTRATSGSEITSTSSISKQRLRRTRRDPDLSTKAINESCI